MIRKWMTAVCVCMLLAAFGSCSLLEDELYEDTHYDEGYAADSADGEALLEAQLGLLNDYINDDEREEALSLVEEIAHLQEDRIREGEYEKSAEEEGLLGELNQFYDDCTEYYLLDDGDWEYYDEDYEAPEEKTLATYQVTDNGSVRLAGNKSIDAACPWTNHDIRKVWNEIMEILPEECRNYFVKLVVFTDGAEETLAYVEQADDYGMEWTLAIDPADYDDRELFVETIVHEFFHCVTLNDEQALYTDEPDVDTYTEEYDDGAYCVYYEDSYIQDFYEAFWTQYIDDREINMESEYFYLRHEDDFVTEYAATMPSEDICESFAYFVLYEEQGGDAVWEQKMSFFYDYPELVEYRDEIRTNLGM